jgi:hypothetical protein
MLCESWLQEQGLSLGPTLQMASNKGDPRRGGLGDGGGGTLSKASVIACIYSLPGS